MLLNHGISLHIIFSYIIQTFWVTFQAMNSIRSTPASFALSQALRLSHNAHRTNCHQHGSGERNETQRRTKVSFDRTTMHMQALEQLLAGQSASQPAHSIK